MSDTCYECGLRAPITHTYISQCHGKKSNQTNTYLFYLFRYYPIRPLDLMCIGVQRQHFITFLRLFRQCRKYPETCFHVIILHKNNGNMQRHFYREDMISRIFHNVSVICVSVYRDLIRSSAELSFFSYAVRVILSYLMLVPFPRMSDRLNPVCCARSGWNILPELGHRCSNY